MSDRFHVTYLLTLTAGEDPEERIRALQLEQSAELPDHVVQSLGMQHVTGSVTAATTVETPSDGLREGLQQLRVTIAWPKNNLGNEITQLLNVLFGNISMMNGIAITDIRWEDVAGGKTVAGQSAGGQSGQNTGGSSEQKADSERGLVAGGRSGLLAGDHNRLFAGPAYGIQQIRKKWNIHGRALACTALKPMGYSSRKLADLAFRFALGGVDIIKDDHGLADQPTAPFTERVAKCVETVDRAAQTTGRRSRYFPNITTDPHRVTGRFEQAAELGADGVLLCPMLVGPALMHHLARLETGLPIMAHPAFSGSLIAHGIAAGAFDAPPESPPMPNTQAGSRWGSSQKTPFPLPQAPHGFEPGLFYGGLMRALGADFTIYPNTGGRFSFSREICDAINSQARRPDHLFAPCFPTPGGGMQRDRMAYWLDTYGVDTTFLMGGSLFEDPAGIEAASRAFMETLGA